MLHVAKNLTKGPLVAATVVFLLVLVIAGQQSGTPATALPIYARRYDVTCQTCHTVAPRLNQFGMAFQANNFNWPGHPPTDREGLSAIPISGIAAASTVGSPPDGEKRTVDRHLALYASGGFSLAGRPNGGYLVRTLAATSATGARAGDLDSAFAALPVAGKRGQWALLAGQMAPMNYSWDDHNDLTDSMPMALNAPSGYSMETPMPGFRLDYFSNRGRRDPSGDYLSVGVPFGGMLALNSGGRWGHPGGAYAQAFRRQGDNTVGVFADGGNGESLAGLLASHELINHLYLWGAASTGHDAAGTLSQVSVQLTATPTPYLGLVARLEGSRGAMDTNYPVLGATYYPGHQQTLRLQAESAQQPGSRVSTVFAFVQF